MELIEREQPWNEARISLVFDRVRAQLARLAVHLGDRDWLDGAFSAGDLVMISILLRTRPSRILDELPSLAAYVARGEARPAYQRAIERLRSSSLTTAVP